jgi:hypothetical protein
VRDSLAETFSRFCRAASPFSSADAYLAEALPLQHSLGMTTTTHEGPLTPGVVTALRRARSHLLGPYRPDSFSTRTVMIYRALHGYGAAAAPATSQFRSTEVVIRRAEDARRPAALIAHGVEAGHIERRMLDHDIRYRRTEPVEAAFVGFAELQSIHPFEDFNGRVGRVGLHLDLTRVVDRPVPPIGLLLAAQGTRHEDALTRFSRFGSDVWLEYVQHILLECSQRFVTSRP